MKLLTLGLVTAMATSAMGSMKANLRNLQDDSCTAKDDAGNCTECAFRYVLIDGKCVAVSDQCKEWDASSGACTACYGGYSIVNGECVVTEDGGSSNPGTGDCNFRQVKIDGNCVSVSDLCAAWDETSGACTSCYGGYVLSEGACVSNSSVPPGPATSCEFRQVLIDGSCVAVSDLCATWDEVTGACTSCYGGYNLAEGVCSADNSGGSSGG